MARQVTVYYLHPPDHAALSFLKEQLTSQIRLVSADDGPMPKDTDVLIAGRPKQEHLEASRKLKALIVPWSGIPDETRLLVRGYPAITLHNLHHNAAPVAELALALLLAVSKRVLPMDSSLRANNWAPRYLPSGSLLLENRTVLILGYGAIGKRVADICHHLGMVVMAIRRQPAAGDLLQPITVHPPEMLHTLLPQTQALVICLPHTEETYGLIGQYELDLLPADALLVNIGRGAVVDEGALYSALRDGRLHGAGLDVWYNYPPDKESRINTPPANFPFHELENVVMSPHRGGDTTDTDRLRMIHLASLLNVAAKGKVMPNVVDLLAGY